MRTTLPCGRWVVVLSVAALFAAACNQGRPTIEAGPSVSPTSRAAIAAEAVAPDCEELRVPASVDGPLSDDPDIAGAQRARAENGLPSSEQRVRAVLGQTEGESYPMGFPHTEEEFDELMARNRLGEHAGAIRVWAEREASDAFAGMWLDHEAGGVFTVAFTRDVERFRRTLHERFDPAIRVVEADHPMSDLRRLQDEVSQTMQGQFGPGADGDVRPGMIVSTGANDATNRVQIGVFEPDEQIRRRMSDRWGADRICLEPIDIPEAEDAQPAGWVPAPDADLSPDSTRIDVLVNEFACAGGQSAEGRIVPPDIDYRADAVVITIEVIPKPGPNDCPGNPDTPYTVELDEPLDGRQLLDGRNDPPTAPSLDYDHPE